MWDSVCMFKVWDFWPAQCVQCLEITSVVIWCTINVTDFTWFDEDFNPPGAFKICCTIYSQSDGFLKKSSFNFLLWGNFLAWWHQCSSVKLVGVFSLHWTAITGIRSWPLLPKVFLTSSDPGSLFFLTDSMRVFLMNSRTLLLVTWSTCRWLPWMSIWFFF